MYTNDQRFGSARMEQFHQMMANSPPSTGGLRRAIGRALVGAGSRLLPLEIRLQLTRVVSANN
jgi:hypothetical protein